MPIADLRRRSSQRAALAFALALMLGRAHAQQKPPAPPPREVIFEWDRSQRYVMASVSYRDVVDANIRKKLSRGLPTTIVMTATLHSPGSAKPISTTVQSCRITWHVWEEVYLVEITRPGRSHSEWTTTIEGVLRRCAEARRLLAADRSQIVPGIPLYMSATVQVNPVSPEILKKIKRWVNRPTGTGTAAPGDALFSTFTGLFLQRIGEAERELEFSTKTVLPRTYPKEKPK